MTETKNIALELERENDGSKVPYVYIVKNFDGEICGVFSTWKAAQNLLESKPLDYSHAVGWPINWLKGVHDASRD